MPASSPKVMFCCPRTVLELPGSLAALSPFRPHVWVALRDQSKVRVGRQGSGCLDPDQALRRTFSHDNPADDA